MAEMNALKINYDIDLNVEKSKEFILILLVF